MKHIYFWVAFIDLIYVFIILAFIAYAGVCEQFIFYKQYCLIFMPILLGIMFQFVIFYDKLTNNQNNNITKL